ncbi:DNA polymerase III subunit delta' [Geobacter sulfurreducens]|uniref:DNA polymerase III subunit delta' n=1 Tax=Geobacter sulfurreducens (strain ATCC 51573 / DSM 12127 / PCA) TaxID=243231 RepID=Q74AW9_GEOSL|nr:DNA polymerase III subunit delta' [Geobacter sulfurreducens]AAR35606.1 DNA polymerase III, delta-prime subunit [Geobacter sulfurreducens PCA]ADI84988.1 DNA polymerase III, delta-prime subunit [Geobacter sulfurreducens KN400]UAC02946.1 DNA polymerase III subunit delta' [Geobacter sulfurreducens]HBB69472.1 DNA polymerase III subunit delta' [Geobacter sulfurreducens]HCD94993.1 DNA polymerase III subunit delta' [Geobacter sulfurreducens]
MPFSRVLGQETAVNVLQRALRSGKTAHAYLFEGIEGCGKMTTALAFIEAAFCRRDDGCGSCPSCRKMAGLQHPDLHRLAPEGAFIKIDQVRELQRELSLRPVEAPMKACIIDDADRLNPAAANALLKTLEEPPGNALLILLTTNPAGILPTVRSRCQLLRFSPLPERVIEEYLTDAGREPAAARLAASLAGGSLSRALEMEEGSAGTARQGLIERLRTLTLEEITPLFAAAEELAADRERAVEALGTLTSLLRDVLLIQGGSNEVVNRDLVDLLEEEACRMSPERTLTRLGHVMEARQALQRNANPRLTMDVLLMRLADRTTP